MRPLLAQLKASLFLLILISGHLINAQTQNANQELELVILGIAQDAGYPQLACEKECCKRVFESPALAEKVVSIALFKKWENKYFLLEASPDISTQHQFMQEKYQAELAGVFVSHAHIGHYTGLMYFGKEAASTEMLPLYAMPRMSNFLLKNAPWEALLAKGNLELHALRNLDRLPLGDSIYIQVFKVPHRDEYSETIGYRIEGATKSALFIPDIDKWIAWNTDISKLIAEVDYAFIDGTFYNGEELPGRDMSSIPHPFVVESMAHFADLPAGEKKKIFFIHLNHTNPLLDPNSAATKEVEAAGFNVAREKMSFRL